MGFRFRKSVRFGSLVRLNFTGRGVSLGLGPRGANITLSKRGVRQTIGIPGSGISHQTFTKWNTPAADAAPPQVSDQPSSAGGYSWRIVLVIFAGGLGIWALMANDKRAPITVTAASRPAVVPASAAPAAETAASLSAPASRPLTAEEVKEAQILLKALGFDPGGADGIVGPMTIAAVKRYEPSRGWPASGEVDLRLLVSLRASKAAPGRP